ncbi:MAG: hypothetical protein ACRC46_08515 [Thermoguttaceae bacterium]
MSVQIQCPNGHRLVAQEQNAGKTGKCPVCKAAVVIPSVAEQLVLKAASKALSESAVVNLLGSPPQRKAPPTTGTTATSSHAKVIGGTSASSVSKPYTKLCPCCDKEIDMGYHICPHCHTYITGLNDF